MSYNPRESIERLFSSTPTVAPYRLVLEESLFRRMVENITFQLTLFEILENDYRLIGMNPVSLAASQFVDPIGKLMSELYAKEDIEVLSHLFRGACSLDTMVSEDLEIRRGDGQPVWLSLSILPLRDDTGKHSQIMTISYDITAYKIREIEQNRTLAELSTPLLRISDTTLVMPLIGVMDSQRILLMNQTLLEGVSNARAQNVIIDITGVPVVDTQVANTLIQAAQAVKLLGAQVVLSGIRPEVAQILVSLGIDLAAIPTKSSLQAAIASTLI
jgi:anti-anti-sigma regulatory factor